MRRGGFLHGGYSARVRGRRKCTGGRLSRAFLWLQRMQGGRDMVQGLVPMSCILLADGEWRNRRRKQGSLASQERTTWRRLHRRISFAFSSDFSLLQISRALLFREEWPRLPGHDFGSRFSLSEGLLRSQTAHYVGWSITSGTDNTHRETFHVLRGGKEPTRTRTRTDLAGCLLPLPAVMAPRGYIRGRIRASARFSIWY